MAFSVLSSKGSLISYFLEIINFVLPSCGLVSTLLGFFALKYFKLNKMFLYPHLGTYLVLLSLMGMLKALFFIESLRSGYRILFYLLQFCGLLSSLPNIEMLKVLSPRGIIHKLQFLLYPIYSLLIVAVIYDLFFQKGLLVFRVSYICYNGFLYRFVNIPVEMVSLILICALLFSAYARKKESENEKYLLRILFIGMCIKLPFELWDLANIARSPVLAFTFSGTNVRVLNFGFFLFYLCIFFFLLEYIKLNVPLPKQKNGKRSEPNEQLSGSIYRRIIYLMEREKLYMDPDISLDSIAKLTGENKVTISGIINKCYGKNFNTFVNSYRVKEMKHRLCDPENSMSIMDIGLDSGFNSIASINRVFFRFENMSPLAYRQYSQKSVQKIIPAELTGTN